VGHLLWTIPCWSGSRCSLLGCPARSSLHFIIACRGTLKHQGRAFQRYDPPWQMSLSSIWCCFRARISSLTRERLLFPTPNPVCSQPRISSRQGNTGPVLLAARKIGCRKSTYCWSSSKGIQHERLCRRFLWLIWRIPGRQCPRSAVWGRCLRPLCSRSRNRPPPSRCAPCRTGPSSVALRYKICPHLQLKCIHVLCAKKQYKRDK